MTTRLGMSFLAIIYGDLLFVHERWTVQSGKKNKKIFCFKTHLIRSTYHLIEQEEEDNITDIIIKHQTSFNSNNIVDQSRQRKRQ